MQKIIQIPTYLYYSLALLWLYSGIMPMLFAQQLSLDMLAEMGIGDGWRWLLFISASVLDILYAILILSAWRERHWFRWVWLAQFLTVAIYSVLIGIFLPENWTHPFAPLVKNIPIMAMLFWLWQLRLMKNEMMTL